MSSDPVVTEYLATVAELVWSCRQDRVVTRLAPDEGVVQQTLEGDERQISDLY